MRNFGVVIVNNEHKERCHSDGLMSIRLLVQAMYVVRQPLVLINK